MSAKWKRRWSAIGGTVAGAFAVGFLFGTGAAAADPHNGWEAWRVGMTAGLVCAGSLGVICLIGAFVSWMDDA